MRLARFRSARERRAHELSTSSVLCARDAASSGLPLASNYTWPMFGHRADTFWHWQYRFLFSLSLSLSLSLSFSLFLCISRRTHARFAISFHNEFIESARGFVRDWYSANGNLYWIPTGMTVDDCSSQASQRDRARSVRRFGRLPW